MPQLYLLIILASIITPSFWMLLIFLLLFSWMNLTGVVRAEFLRGRNLDYVRAAQALGVSDRCGDVAPHPAQRLVATLTFLPFTLSGSVTILASLDFLGFGLPPGSPSLGELVSPGQEQPAGALAGHHRLRRAGRHADPADLHRRGGARRVRPAQDPVGTAMSLLEVEDLTVAFGDQRVVDDVSLHAGSRRDPGAGRRKRLGQVADRAVAAAAAAAGRDLHRRMIRSTGRSVIGRRTTSCCAAARRHGRA